MSNELGPVKAPFRVGAAKTGLAARKEAEKAAGIIPAERPVEINPTELPHRIGIVFDDSGSMDEVNKINDAHAGVEEFLRSCEAGTTAVAVYPMCSEHYPLTSNLPALAILVNKIRATGRTPLRQTLLKMKRENNLTRMIVFSDGSPNDPNLDGFDKEFGIVDTVFISNQSSYSAPRDYMQQLAERTGGIFLEFQAGKANFKTAFKYLSPGLRYMLADKSFVEQIQK